MPIITSSHGGDMCRPHSHLPTLAVSCITSPYLGYNSRPCYLDMTSLLFSGRRSSKILHRKCNATPWSLTPCDLGPNHSHHVAPTKGTHQFAGQRRISGAHGSRCTRLKTSGQASQPSRDHTANSWTPNSSWLVAVENVLFLTVVG